MSLPPAMVVADDPRCMAGVKACDEFTNMNDLFCRVWMNEETAQESDTHWRAKRGKGSFNWRFKFPITWPRKESSPNQKHSRKYLTLAPTL